MAIATAALLAASDIANDDLAACSIA